MLRSTLHLSEILKERPESIASEESPPSGAQDQWSPKSVLIPGQFHRVNVKYLQPSSSPPQGLSDSNIPNGDGDRYSYDKRLSSTDDPPVIRLLCIYPGRKGDPIAGGLHYVPLDQPSDYEAISYCWEGQKPSVTVTCNGAPLRITKNLSDAIQALRREETNLFLWADAICIDQSSIEEKNCQVPLMRQIYRKATLVHIWLGDDTPTQSGQEAFHVLRELYSAYNKLDWKFNFFEKGARRGPLDACKIPALHDPSWTSVLALLQKPWFARAWIIQEVVISQRALLHIGNASLGWNECCFGFLFAINAGLLTPRADTLEYSSVLSHLSSLMITYVTFREPTYDNLDLPSLLQSHRLVGATDPKDKIYALLGLSTEVEGQAHGILTDYSLSTAQVYLDASKAIISKSKSLDILGVPRSAPDPVIGNLPSWVVDWSVPHLSNSFSFKGLRGEYEFDFNATGRDVPKQAAFQGTSLILNGHVADTIVKVGRSMDPFAESAIDEFTRSRPLGTSTSFLLRMMHVYAVLQDWCDIAAASFPGRSSSTISADGAETLNRTLMLDQTREGDLRKDFSRHNYRLFHGLFRFVSYLFRHRRFVKFLNWSETHRARILLYASFRVKNGGAVIYMIESLAKLMGRRMVATKSGFLGLVPKLAETGDCIAIIKGAKVPLVLRPVNGAKWELIGDCYVHGIMHGEAFEEDKCEDIEIL